MEWFCQLSKLMKVNLHINIVQWVICCTCLRLIGRDIVLSHALLKAQDIYRPGGGDANSPHR